MPGHGNCYLTSTYSNGSMLMTGNDLISNGGWGHNIYGGHGHFITGNRFHDSTDGAHMAGVSGGIIENNLCINNGPGLAISELPTVPEFESGDLLVRHSVVANNSGPGIVYEKYGDSDYTGAPIVYNNVAAFNDASGIVAIGYPGGTYSFVPGDLNILKEKKK